MWEPIVRVPLLIRRSGGVASRSDVAVSTIDLMPSILSHVGVAVPPNLDGVVLRDRSRTSTIFTEATGGLEQQKALIRDRAKWFVTVHHGSGVTDKWTLDVADAAAEERSGASWREGLEADALLESIEDDPDKAGIPREYEAGMKRNAPKVAPGRTAQQTEALRALGYVE